MKIGIFILILLIQTINSVGQIIRGTILDQNTRIPINYATIYFSGSGNGAFSDQNGNFKIDATKYSSIPLTISALGYYSNQVTDVIPGKQYLIYLLPKTYELNEVRVSSKSNSLKRKINFNTFKNEFLGRTMNASSCVMLNEDDIILDFHSDNDTIKAFALEPIKIYNKALGYIVTYYLDRFIYCPSSKYLLIQGNYLFNEYNNQQTAKQRTVTQRKRNTAYLGSRMHFFRVLWENKLDQSGFVIKDSLNAKITYDRLIELTDSLSDKSQIKNLRFNGTINVAYHSMIPQSKMKISKEKVWFTRDGFFDPFGIIWEGEMANQRIGDLLPFEYLPSENNR